MNNTFKNSTVASTVEVETHKTTIHTDSRSVCFTSLTDNWPTPGFLVPCLLPFFPFTLDPCATAENAKAPKFYTLDDEGGGLARSWADEIVWMNPPYGKPIWEWMRKARRSALYERATVVCLVPVRTATRWWHDCVIRKGVGVIFIKGQLTFGDAVNTAPFASALVIMQPDGSAPLDLDAISAVVHEAKARDAAEKRKVRAASRAVKPSAEFATLALAA